MDRPYEHLREPGHLAQRLPNPRHNAFLQLAGGLIGEGESDDVGRVESASLRIEEVHNAPSYNLRLARPRASDQLQVSAGVLDRLLLRLRQLHAVPATISMPGSSSR